jgi:hypothetical protein
MVKTLFYTLLREICVWKPLPKVKISISKAHFFAAQTMTDFFNRIGRFLPVTMGNSTALFACHMGYEEWGGEWGVFKFVTCHFSAVFSDNVFWGQRRSPRQ